jgi:acetyltransferase-like isoleucine patch superfamily enzyme
MAYGKKHQRLYILRALKIKFGRMLAAGFPLNSVRVWGLKLCGFDVGKNVYVGYGLLITMFNIKSNCDLVIGNRVAFAPRVTLVLASDANWSQLNTILHPVEGKIIIEDDSWIGAGAIIMPDVVIGKMSVIGAGSVVIKNVPPYTIVAGVPAKIIRELPTNTT